MRGHLSIVRQLMSLQTDSQFQDTQIWRYMDLARYVGLLDRGVFFACVTSFHDPWEASFGGVDAQKFREAHRQLDRAENEKQWERRLQQKQTSLSKLGVSCWHIAERESVALWELYLPKGLGIAVKSTVGRLHDAISDSSRNIESLRINYTNYEEIETTDDPLKLLSIKRQEFSHEKEIRFVIKFRDDELAAMNALIHSLELHQNRPVSSWPPRPLILPGKGYSSFDSSISRRVAPSGVHLETNVERLLDQVVLAPGVAYPTRRAVQAITEAFGVDRHVIGESKVDQIPYDRLKFVDA